MKKFISILMVLTMTLCVMLTAIPSVSAAVTQYVWDGTTTGWTTENVNLNGTRSNNFAKPSLGTETGDGVWSAVYDNVIWKDNYTFSGRAYFYGAGSSSRLNAYFNRQDDNNYYYMSIAGDNNGYPVAVQIFKKSGSAAATRIHSYNTTDTDILNDRIFSYSLTYKKGNIKVSVTGSDNVTTNIIDINDNTFSSGKIGFFLETSQYGITAHVDSILVSGEYEVEPLYKWDGTTTDWILNNVDLAGTRNSSFGNPSFGTNDGSGVWSAIYTGQTFKESYTLSARAYLASYGGNERLNVYFNYKDANNYYRMSVAGGQKDGSAKQIAVQIYEMINGTEKRTLSYDTTSADIYDSRIFSFDLTYNKGNVKVSATNSSGAKNLIINHNLENNSLTEGNIGFYTQVGTGTISAYVDSIIVYEEMALSLTDSEGVSADKIEKGKTYTASVNLCEADATLYAAVYSNGGKVMEDIAVGTADEVTVAVPNDAAKTYSVKVFYFNKNTMPLITALERAE